VELLFIKANVAKKERILKTVYMMLMTLLLTTVWGYWHWLESKVIIFVKTKEESSSVSK